MKALVNCEAFTRGTFSGQYPLVKVLSQAAGLTLGQCMPMAETVGSRNIPSVPPYFLAALQLG